MAFDLVIGTAPAQALQVSIQDELQRRGFSPDADPVMAEYITIMLINNKSPDQITAELQDLIGVNEYDPSFTDWLFAEAARKSHSAAEPVPEPEAPAPLLSKPEERSSSPETSRRAPTGPRGGTTQIYNQALNQALPSGSQTGQKRTASARSPSPVPGPHNKSRRTDLPTGPRAMHGREGGQRSLLDRMGGRQQGGPRHGRDEIQARIDQVTGQGPMNGMNGVFSPGMPGMMMPGNDMAAAAAAAAMGGMMNPLALQEMMMNQMAIMAQMANSMGLLNNQGQFPNGLQNNGANVPTPDGQQQENQHQQRRNGPHAGRGGGPKGPLKAQWVAPHVAEANKTQALTSPAAATIASPTPQLAAEASVEPSTAGFTPPERPQSPSLCKFGLKCTNALCRYSHPSPVATPESGVVLSNDPCEAGIACKDKDCIKAHVSPAAVGFSGKFSYSVPVKPKPKVEAAQSTLKPPCRYGANCTKAPLGTCPFSHPFIPKSSPQAQAIPCRFGAACTRATCPFQHPAGRVLPGTFHRGLSESSPTVSVRAPHTGTMGAPSANRSVVFNKPSTLATTTTENDKSEPKAAGDGENTVVQAAA